MLLSFIIEYTGPNMQLNRKQLPIVRNKTKNTLTPEGMTATSKRIHVKNIAGAKVHKHAIITPLRRTARSCAHKRDRTNI